MYKRINKMNLKAVVAGAAFLSLLSYLAPESARAGLFRFSSNPNAYEDLFELDSSVINTSNNPEIGLYNRAIKYKQSEQDDAIFTYLTVGKCCLKFEPSDPSLRDVQNFLRKNGFRNIRGDIYQYYFPVIREERIVNTTNTLNVRRISVISFYLPSEFKIQNNEGVFTFRLKSSELPNRTLVGLDRLAKQARRARVENLVLPTNINFRYELNDGERFNDGDDFLGPGFANTLNIIDTP